MACCNQQAAPVGFLVNQGGRSSTNNSCSAVSSSRRNRGTHIFSIAQASRKISEFTWKLRSTKIPCCMCQRRKFSWYLLNATIIKPQTILLGSVVWSRTFCLGWIGYSAIGPNLLAHNFNNIFDAGICDLFFTSICIISALKLIKR